MSNLVVNIMNLSIFSEQDSKMFNVQLSEKSKIVNEFEGLSEEIQANKKFYLRAKGILLTD